jgi:biotin carboxyl carrier protein
MQAPICLFLAFQFMSTITVNMPKYPECWESCGSCASGNVFILEILVRVGDVLQFDENILTLETGKVALDIPTPHAGRVVAIHVTEGDTVDSGAPLVTLEPA